MSVSAGVAYLDIGPRLQRNFSRDLTSQMFRPAGQAADRTGNEAGKRFGRGFAGGAKTGTRPAVGVFRSLRAEMANAFGGRAAAALGGAAIAAGLYKTVQAASDLNETVNKTRVVFGPAARVVEQFGDRSATALGLSRQQALEATATLGNLFVSMKLGQRPAAEMSTRMVTLASDLASFNNADPSEVLEALRAGLVGETEPLRRFGINLNDAALKAEAVRLGLGKIGPTLTASQRAQAAYSLILQQSKTAQGDFARTSGGLANQQRILAAEFKDAQAALGEQLLPAMLSGVRIANRLLDGFAGLNRATGGLAAQGLLAAGGLTAVGIGVIKVAGYVKTARDAWGAYRATTLTAAAADTILTRQQLLLGISTTTAGNAAEGAGAKFAVFGRLSVASLGAFAAAAAAGAYQGKNLADMTLKGTKVSGPFAEVRAKILRGLGFEATAVKKVTGEQQAANAATQAGKQAGDAYAQALAAVAGGQQDTSAKTAELTGKLKELKDGFHTQVEAVRESILAYDGLINKSDVTATEVIGDLHNQVANFKTYSRDTQRLIKAGVNPAAIQELSQKGPQYVHALAVGSNRQLQTYKQYWHDRQAEVRGSFADSMERQYQNLVKKIKAMQRAINALTGKNINISATTSLHFTKTFTQKDWMNARLAAGRQATGGPVGTFPRNVGPPGGKDTELRWLDPTEHVWTGQEVAAAGGHKAMKRWRKAVLAGQVPGMVQGGAVGIANTDRAYSGVNKIQGRWARLIQAAGVKEALAFGGGMLGGLSGPGGVRWQMAVLRRAFPGLALISGFRRGAVTHATGRQSYHAVGRAVDVPPRMDVFNWIRGNYGKRTKELIFSPAGSRQVHNGRPHMYTGVTRDDHWNHVHWAYDKGGMLPPGTSLATNNTGKPERVLGPDEPVIDYRRLGQEVARALAGVQLVVKPENLVTGLRAHKRTLGGQALGLS